MNICKHSARTWFRINQRFCGIDKVSILSKLNYSVVPKQMQVKDVSEQPGQTRSPTKQVNSYSFCLQTVK